MVNRLRSSTTTSAKYPGARTPRFVSSNVAKAFPAVYARKASPTVIFCSGTQPPGFLPWSERRDGPIRPEGQLRPGVEQRAERVGRLDAYGTDPFLHPPAVVDRVVRLHRRDHAQPSEERHVLRPQVLRMLDPEPAVARAMGLRHAVVDGEDDRIGAVPNGVHGDLEARRVGAADPGAHVALAVAGQAVVPCRVGVRLEEERCPRSRRAV